MDKISILVQRQIEANVLMPVVKGLSVQFGEIEVLKNIRTTIEKMAFEDGEKLNQNTKDKNQLSVLGKHWQKLADNSALIIEDFKVTKSELSLRVKRCKYAEYYQELNSKDLGKTISCCRDEAFLKGFSKDITMHRSKTILEGNDSCDFKYQLKRKKQ